MRWRTEEYHNKNDEEGNVLFVYGLLFIPKYAIEAASGSTSVSPCIRKKLPVADIDFLDIIFL